MENIRISSGQPRGYLLCTQCGFEYLHITRVSVRRGEDKVTITGNSVSIDEQKNISRGVIIEIEYSGECGHRGEIIFHFYEGNVEVYHRPLKDRPTEHDIFTDEIKDIFRD